MHSIFIDIFVIKGTYSWYIARDPVGVPTAWYSSMDVPFGTKPAVAVGEARKPPPPADKPILRYEVTSVYSTSHVSVYTFTQPQSLFTCSSQLSALIEPYIALCHKRACMRRADMYNSQLSAVFEKQHRGTAKDQADTGGGVGTEESGKIIAMKEGLENYQKLQYEVLSSLKSFSNLPDDTVTIFAPTNYSVHSLDKVISPQVIFMFFIVEYKKN